jgi:hypothetical protein
MSAKRMAALAAVAVLAVTVLLSAEACRRGDRVEGSPTDQERAENRTTETAMTSSLPEKKNYVFASDVERLVPSLGGCIVADSISVDARPIGLMERGDPVDDVDSGWMFAAGDEAEEYFADPNNATVFDVNTIANYDPAIVEFLTYPAGTRIERRNGHLTVVEGPSERPDVRFLPPARPGPVRLSDSLQVNVPRHMLRREEKGQTVLWRPGLTLFVSVSQLPEGSTAGEKIAAIRAEASKERFEERLDERDGVTRFSYRLDEARPGGSKQPSLYTSAISASQWLLLAFHFDDAAAEADARAIWNSLTPAADP